MLRPTFPVAVRHHPYAAAAYVMALGSASVYLSSAVLEILARDSAHEPLVALLSLGIAIVAGAVGWAVGTGRIQGDRALDLATTLLALVITGAILASMALSPELVARRLPYLLIVAVACGAVLRRLTNLVVVILAVSAVWSVFAANEPSTQSRTDWIATWVVTAGVALALHAYVRTMLHSAREVQVETARDAHRDPLTGVANRAGFLDHVSALERDAARRGEPLWSAFLDVDRFKSVNDRFGHETGDAVLVAVAAALRAESRGSDLVARWGGDEFLVLGVGDAPDADALEKRIASRLEPLGRGPASSWIPAVTIGVASLSTVVAGDAEEVVTAADARMYERRRARRSMVSD